MSDDRASATTVAAGMAQMSATNYLVTAHSDATSTVHACRHIHHESDQSLEIFALFGSRPYCVIVLQDPPYQLFRSREVSSPESSFASTCWDLYGVVAAVGEEKEIGLCIAAVMTP